MKVKRYVKKTSFVIFLVFVLIVAFFSIFGKNIRDHYSPHVSVIPIAMCFMESENRYVNALPVSCLIADDITGETAFFHIEKRDRYGEPAFVAVKNGPSYGWIIRTGATDGVYIEIVGGNWSNKNFIYITDRPVKDGDRVVVVQSEE